MFARRHFNELTKIAGPTAFFPAAPLSFQDAGLFVLTAAFAPEDFSA